MSTSRLRPSWRRAIRGAIVRVRRTLSRRTATLPNHRTDRQGRPIHSANKLDPTDPAGNGTVEQTLAATLDSLDHAVNYMQWIVDLVGPHLKAPILEVGAGHGTFTSTLACHGEVHAVEPSARAADLLRERVRDDSRVRVTEGVTGQLPASPAFGSAVMINVLEHIEDDGAALHEIRSRLLPGGRIAVWVPAFDLLFSECDRKLGHHRRYRRPALDELMRSAGFEVVESRYVNLVGWFSWLLVVKLLRIEPANGTAVRFFDRRLIPAIRCVESRVRVPFGQSILAVGRAV